MDDYIKFKSIIDEIDVLIKRRVDSSDSKFRAWKVKAERFLINKYGDESYEVKNFRSFYFSAFGMVRGTKQEVYIEACLNDLCTIKPIFEQYLEDIREQEESRQIENRHATGDYSKVFIVHGHDGELKEAVARIIEKQGIKAVILSEQVNRFSAIIEKIERNSDVSGAVCLFTSDDFGRAKEENMNKPRARQNVIFETGYFVGKLGRENVVLINDGNVEMPSDLQGIVYTHTDEWKFKVLQELKAIGYNIDYNKIDG